MGRIYINAGKAQMPVYFLDDWTFAVCWERLEMSFNWHLAMWLWRGFFNKNEKLNFCLL